jgi:hypothetical protein
VSDEPTERARLERLHRLDERRLLENAPQKLRRLGLDDACRFVAHHEKNRFYQRGFICV